MSLFGDHNLIVSVANTGSNVYHTVAQNEKGRTLVIATDEPCTQTTKSVENDEFRSKVQEEIKMFLSW